MCDRGTSFYYDHYFAEILHLKKICFIFVSLKLSQGLCFYPEDRCRTLDSGNRKQNA